MSRAKLPAARAALLRALDASEDREVHRYIDEALQHLHALEAELAADQRARPPGDTDDE